VPDDGSTRTYLHGDPFAPAADFELTRALVDTARARGVEPTVGVVQSVDVFYNTDADYASKMRGRGIVAVEMEASALFYLAMRERGRRKDVRGACILTVSDTLMADDEAVGVDYMSLESLEAAVDWMHERDLVSAFLVSDPWHNLRVRRMASDLGIRGYLSATWHSAARSEQTRLAGYVREVFAYLYYRVVGR